MHGYLSSLLFLLAFGPVLACASASAGDSTRPAPETEEARQKNPAPDRDSPEYLHMAPTFTPYTVQPDITNRAEVARALEMAYPPLLRDQGISGTARVWFFIDAGGNIQRIQIRESSGNPLLDEAALKVARTIKFTPAINGVEEVPVWISLPITFTVRRGPSSSSPRDHLLTT